MKRIGSVLVVALIALVSGCSLFSKGSPTAALTAYYEAAKKKDVPGIKKYLSKKSLALFEDQAKKEGKALDEFIKESVDGPGAVTDKMPEVRNEKINSDTATVEMKREKSDQWDTVAFVKEDDGWKLAFDRMVGTPAPASKP